MNILFHSEHPTLFIGALKASLLSHNKPNCSDAINLYGKPDQNAHELVTVDLVGSSVLIIVNVSCFFRKIKASTQADCVDSATANFGSCRAKYYIKLKGLM